MKTTTLAVMALVLVGCKGEPEEDPIPTLEPPAEGEGFQLSMTATVEPYTEAWICEVYPMPIDEPASVNWMKFIQTEGMHHMTLSTPSLTDSPFEHGTYNCEDLYTEMLPDQVMFYGNQGFADGEMHLPDGVAATFPTGLDILHEVHYVNPTEETIQLYSIVNAYTIPDYEVEEGIWGGQVRDEYINIPANSEHTEWTRCVMNEDIEVLFLASHFHQLGIQFDIALFDGTDAGEVFYSNTDWHDPKIVQYEPALSIKAGTGFEFTCTWQNDSDEAIEYGTTSTDEMCNLAIVHTPMSITAQCEVVDSSDGVLWEG